MYYYSPSASGFFLSTIHPSLPNDAVELSAEEYEQLIAAQEHGKQITVNALGRPVAVTTTFTEADLAQQRITEIQSLLTANDLASVRPLRAKLAGTATEFDDARLAELEEQAQALRAELVTLNALV